MVEPAGPAAPELCCDAAAARLHGQILVTRDADFQRIPGLAVEGY